MAGTIPANTGKIAGTSRVGSTARDHPREYGENRPRLPAHRGNQGPSPRIRGKCYGDSPGSGEWGTIPANTGKMTMAQAPRPPHTDHPREYGENHKGNGIN